MSIAIVRATHLCLLVGITQRGVDASGPVRSTTVAELRAVCVAEDDRKAVAELCTVCWMVVESAAA
jgi:hypothetical protein